MGNELQENKELVLFDENKIRKTEFEGEWFYSIVDVIGILTEQTDYTKSRKYWNKLSQRLSEEENSEVVTNCHRLKLLAKDGKMRETDCANRETIFRLIQSVPSPKSSYKFIAV